jgi:hypothetical protein
MGNIRDAVSREDTMAKTKGKWIGKATAKMEKKGTVGKFGAATSKKIAAGKKKGGVEEKRAVFAENMKKIAAKHKGTAMKGKRSSGGKAKGKGRKRASGK